MNDDTYLVAGARPWNHEVFERRIRKLPGRWTLVQDRDALTAERVAALAPRYVFFLHWSWKVPEAITGAHECVNFHMTDLPYGRGGSPLQNLIARGHRTTVLTALRMTGEIDAGPVYLRRPVSLEGLAEEIYLRVSTVAAEMIEQIIHERPEPQPQAGDAVVFERRRPPQSEIGQAASLDELFDVLRMLDAEGYPRAFLVHRGYRYEIRRPARRSGRIEAEVTITPAGDADP